LNLSKTWDDKNDGFIAPYDLSPTGRQRRDPVLASLLPLPLVRKYILPDKGETFIHRDFNGQELRILGHFEDGALLKAYQDDPTIDVHAWVKEMILEHAGLEYHRTQVKITNFRRIYGGGAPAMAQALHISVEAAKSLLAAHSKALPGLDTLQKQIKALSDSGAPIVTWGGREYYVEPPGYSERFKRHMTYEYKLLNYLIQGSAADATKEAILRYHKHPKRRGRFLVTVYDEINVSAKAYREEMRVLKETMESLEFDVLMLSDGKVGPNWGALTKYEDPS
jgi:DNA polymerase-1